MLQGRMKFSRARIISVVLSLPLLGAVLFLPNARADGFNALVQALSDPAEVCKAAPALGELKDSRAVEPLIEATLQNKDRNARRCAAEALAEIGAPGSVYILLPYLEDKDLATASRAAAALGILKDRRAVRPLLHALTEGNLPGPAAESLGMIKDPASVEPLISALSHENGSVRARSAGALGKIGDPRACKPLIEIFLYDFDGLARNEALAAFDLIGCSYEEHGREFAGDDSLCSRGQEIIDFISANIDTFPEKNRFERSGMWTEYLSMVTTEADQLSATDPGAGEKLLGVMSMALEWAELIKMTQTLLQRSDDESWKAKLLKSADVGVRDKRARLLLTCPKLQIPDLLR